MSDERLPAPGDEAEARAERFRAMAQYLKIQAVKYEMFAKMAAAQASMERFAAAFAASEVRDIATHPDLAELNAQMNGYYDGPER